ncbi:hypothetical protein DPMN_113680 [Dreissena polymorpha]|uniref:Uncharacterized protein n=1 Tax=Dreissena polymorpha TaxID=45954 RepID=A0A9D4KHX7_DREPO|nr:hypothetical protein DPMN_113680 [Dreissena polymorpha]
MEVRDASKYRGDNNVVTSPSMYRMRDLLHLKWIEGPEYTQAVPESGYQSNQFAASQNKEMTIEYTNREMNTQETEDLDISVVQEEDFKSDDHTEDMA